MVKGAGIVGVDEVAHEGGAGAPCGHDLRGRDIDFFSFQVMCHNSQSFDDIESK